MGGGMSYVLGCRVADRIAAIAPVSALHGETWSAFRLHPLWTFVVIIVGAIVVAEIASFIQSGGFHDYVGRSVLHRAGLGLSVLLFLLWAIRFLGAFGGPAPI